MSSVHDRQRVSSRVGDTASGGEGDAQPSTGERLVETALIMAGGRSTRMRVKSDSLHKGLKQILGVPLAERVLYHALAHRIREIVCACSTEETELAAFLEERGRKVVEAAGASFQVLYEKAPLGTIGIAAQVADRTKPIVVLNVDNLTTIDLTEFVAHHVRVGANLTVASHMDHADIPYGVLRLDGTRVLEYEEKPRIRLHISSGTYVVEPSACSLIQSGRRTDIPDLVSRLQDLGAPVHAFRHRAHWVDVNDESGLNAALRTARDHQDEFDEWAPQVGELVGLAVHSSGVVGYAEPPNSPVARFDDLGDAEDRIVRYAVFGAAQRPHDRAPERIAARARLLIEAFV